MSADADPTSPRRQAQQATVADDSPGLRAFDSRQLLAGDREVLIRHGSECYRLRHTRNDKLILTK